MTASEASPERFYIFGAGGAGRELAWLAESVMPEAQISFVVDMPEYLGGPVNDVPVQLLRDLPKSAGAPFVVALGDPLGRERAARACEAHGLKPVPLIHPGVERSRWVDIGDGAVICAGSIVTTDVRIGRHVYVNVACTVSHDVAIDDYAALSPGVHVTGNVHVGRGAFIGAGASIINGPSGGPPLVIGEGAVVAAGSCVTASVPARTLVAGVPAVVKKQLTSSPVEG